MLYLFSKLIPISMQMFFVCSLHCNTLIQGCHFFFKLIVLFVLSFLFGCGGSYLTIPAQPTQVQQPKHACVLTID